MNTVSVRQPAQGVLKVRSADNAVKVAIGLPPGQPGAKGEPGKVVEMTQAELAALAGEDALPDRTIIHATDTGILALPLTASTWREYRPIHVGPDEPADTAAIWLQTT